MNRLHRLLLLMLVLFAGVANALIPPSPKYRFEWGSVYVSGYLYDSRDMACAGANDYVSAHPPAGWASARTAWDPTLGTSGRCYVYTKNAQGVETQNGQVNITGGGAATCPANSTAVTGGCQCNATFKESGTQCVPDVNQCTPKTGKVGILSWTEGYTRTPDEGDRSAVGPIMSPPPSGEVCDGGCAVSIQTSGPGVQPYVSQSPTANGLYRRSIDYPSLGLGKQCTAGAADAGAKKDLPPPDCPGSVGDLGDGKPVCVGTASKPVTPTPLGAAPGAAPIAGNPPAGEKPPTGEGSGTGSAGRTPTTGSGTAAGGPAAAAVGGKGGGAGGTGASTAGGMGEAEKPTPCGAPGQPICAVKVDETGTPNGVGTAFDGSKQKQETTFALTSKGITDTVNLTTGPKWDFTFQFPTACSPVNVDIANVVIDMCRHQPMIHDLMSLVWAAVTVFTIIGMVGRTLRGT